MVQQGPNVWTGFPFPHSLTVCLLLSVNTYLRIHYFTYCFQCALQTAAAGGGTVLLHTSLPVRFFDPLELCLCQRQHPLCAASVHIAPPFQHALQAPGARGGTDLPYFIFIRLDYVRLEYILSSVTTHCAPLLLLYIAPRFQHALRAGAAGCGVGLLYLFPAASLLHPLGLYMY